MPAREVIEAAVATAVEDRPEEIREHGEEGVRVLVVDDDPGNVRLLSSLLTERGYDVLAAASGEEALRLLSDRGSATPEPPADILVLDAMMPETSGFDVCEKLRADPSTRTLPILMVIALNSAEEKERALESGADDFLGKPIHRVELFARLRSLLRAKRLREEIESARGDLTAAMLELRRLQQLRTTLAQTIVHDLRGPLTGIMGHAQLLKAKAARGGADLDRLAGSLLRASRHMQRMLADMVDVSLLEEKRFPLCLARTDVRSVAAAAIEEHRDQAGADDVRLELAAEPSGPERGPAVVEADAGVVQRVIGNLVFNALRRTPTGGTVRVVVAPPREGRLEVLVADNGEGFSSEAREEAFETKSPLERGPGLAFCRMAVEAHGGRIWVEPNAAGGSTFGFFLALGRQGP